MEVTGRPPDTRKRVPRGAKILAITGAVLLVLSFLGAHAALDAFHTRVRIIRNTGPDLRNSVLATVKVPGSGTVELEPGQYDVFAISSFGSGFRRRSPSSTTTTTRPGTPSTTAVPTTVPTTDPPATTTPSRRSPVGLDKPVVTLTDPQGRDLIGTQPGVGAIFAGPSGEMYAVSTFEVGEAGTYRLSARGGNAKTVGIAPSVSNGDTNKLLVSGLFTALAFLAGGLGFLLGLFGVIWMLVGGKPPPPPLWPGPAPVAWAAGPPGPSGWSGPPGWTPAPGQRPYPSPTPPPPGPGYAPGGPLPPPPAAPPPAAPAPPGPTGPLGPLGAPPDHQADPWGDGPPTVGEPPARPW